MALLDEHERRLQEKIIYGEPPLGPGAPPDERLAAFYDAMIDLLDTHLHLALGAETGSLRGNGRRAARAAGARVLPAHAIRRAVAVADCRRRSPARRSTWLTRAQIPARNRELRASCW